MLSTILWPLYTAAFQKTFFSRRPSRVSACPNVVWSVVIVYTFELSTVSTRQIASGNFYSFILYFYLHGFFFCFTCYRILFSKIALFFLFTSFHLKQSNCERSTPGTIKPMYRPFWEFKAIIAKQLVFFRFFNNKFRQV